MTSLLALALADAGREERGAILVPASNLAAFLDAAHKAKIDIPYVECLYVGPGSSVEPSMDLSRGAD
ncbi:MAG: hypothetical protein NVV62_09920 [Terricaulis sp.]|nr:hypothetical protein [Terricaulis sp.]